MTKLVFIYTIKIYSFFISPILGQNCRFYPNCSSYAEVAISRHGAIKGTYLAIKRVLRCNPWGSSGIDNVPD